MARRDPTAPPMDRSMRIEAAAARALAALPPSVQLRISGRTKTVRDGQTLDPAIQLTLALIERRGGSASVKDISIGRERAILTRQSIIGAGHPDKVATVRNLQVDGGAGPIAARFYSTPELDGPHPLLVYFHGGGFVLGDLDSHDSVCRTICLRSGVDVLAVDYRLAPENPFPAGVEDARAAFDWALANAADLGSDPTRVFVGGDSAGANLAAVTAMGAAKSLAPPPIAQLLIYPTVDWVEKHPSHGLFGEGFFLTSDQMDWFGGKYMGADPPDLADPRLSPLRAADHSGLAPAFIVTAGFDPLRDEGEAYAAKLEAAGVDVLLRRYPNMIHGFTHMGGISQAAREAFLEMTGALRAFVRQ